MGGRALKALRVKLLLAFFKLFCPMISPVASPEESALPPAEPSSWSRLPTPHGEEAKSERASSRASSPKEASKSSVAARVSTILSGGADVMRDVVRGSAKKVSAEVGESFDRAKAALSEPPAPELEALFTSADLPEIAAADPIGSLALRLDHEADLWRSLALRALSRAALADRIVQTSGIVVGLGAIALAVIAGLGALFGATNVSERLWLICGALLALSVGVALVTWISGTIRRAQREIAREAMMRADLSELRLHRIGMVSALFQMDQDAGRQALLRLERDVSAPPK